jgi:DNA helicase-2/ATP-dependent DNA helicase PcrA
MTAHRASPLTPDVLCGLLEVPFSPQQLDVITAPLQPAVVVAGAGSGKTTVMAARVVWLVTTGAVAPDKVLGLTFTNKAAAELRARVRGALAKVSGAAAEPWSVRDDDDNMAEPTVLTYHAYAGQLLQEHGLRIGHEPDVTLLTNAARFQLAERTVRQHRRPIEHLTTSVPHVVRYLLELDSQLSEHLVTPGDVRAWQRQQRAGWQAAPQTTSVADVLTKFAMREELLALVEDYRAVKAERGVMDFSDSMAAGAALAETCPAVGAQERNAHPVVLLDEYQDTSVAQARLLRSLFRAHPVTAVGDPCQAIYGWRGASASNLDRFADDFPADAGANDSTRAIIGPGTTVANGSTAATEASRAKGAPACRYPLNVNRRSRTAILDAANELAGPLYAAHPGSVPLTAPAGTGVGEVRAALLETFDDELDFVAREVAHAHAQVAVRRWSDIAVLVRDNAAAAAVSDRLVSAEVPVEVVGLSGLLAMPEIVDVVATLEVLLDVTANAALLQLLTSSRWNIGHRDLALLGRRARELAATDSSAPETLAQALELAVAGADPADAVCLLEALHSPGPRHYSAEALERFDQLGAELRSLQRLVGEPLLDLARRVIDTLGIDIELAASSTRSARSRRDNLAAFVDAVAAFAGTGTEASLPGLLAYLRAEEEYAGGLSLAVPTTSDSVKVLTVHKAKGLEWDVVFVPGLARDVFPSRRSRARWTTAPHELPWPLRGDAADLPHVTRLSRQGLMQFAEKCRQHELSEERRLAYVAFTRAREALVATGHWWGPAQVSLRGPSEFLDEVITGMRLRGTRPEVEFPRPAEGARNPANRTLTSYPWPVAPGGEERDRRTSAARLVERAAVLGWPSAVAESDARVSEAERATVDQWDVEIARLIEDEQTSTASEQVVSLPQSLSATTALRLRDDPTGLARDLARPMPRRPSAAARFGTRFHAWVEAYAGQPGLLDVDDLPGRGDQGIESDEELQELISAFGDGPFAALTPLQVEAPFTLVLAGHLIRGRIDAVYQTVTGYQIVDWKTHLDQSADPLQLAIYRAAWAELKGVDINAVRAAFYYVRSGEVVEPADLPGRFDLERLFAG